MNIKEETTAIAGQESRLVNEASNGARLQAARPHIVFLAPRGEAIRNFVYSDTLRTVRQSAESTLFSVVDDRILGDFLHHADRVVPLPHYPDRPSVKLLQGVTDLLHFRWLWSEVAKNIWEHRDFQAKTPGAKIKRAIVKAGVRCLAFRPCVEALAAVERVASSRFRTTDHFDQVFKEIQPSLVFNCSHIHGPAADEPLRAARRLGIPTVAFIFSWDNLTSRGRILSPYDYFLVWHEGMRQQLLALYPSIRPEHVRVTGTPQLDFHFKPEFWLDRGEICRRVGLDPNRPFVLYTAGIDRHFKDEHLHVEAVARLVQNLDVHPKPQLLVRTYVKGTSDAMKALAAKNLPGVVFPPVFWDAQNATPLFEDLTIYTNLLRHCAVGINAASTVSLELMIHDKPIINLGFDPPGSSLDHHDRYIRHIGFDHYKPVAESGAVMVAHSVGEMRLSLIRAFHDPQEQGARRRAFIEEVFGATLDGNSGKRVADVLLEFATRPHAPRSSGVRS